MPTTTPKKLPDELIGRYALYKRGTRKLVHWLTKTAGQSCDLKDHVKSLQESLHLKSGKKRAASAELEIRPAELVKLAEVISNAESASEIPEEVLLIAKDVIEGRERCSEWYNTQALEKGSKVEKENETHRFFILVLQKIVAILTKARAKLFATKTDTPQTSNSKTKKSNKTSTKTDTAIGSLFALLALEEPGPNPLGREPPPLATKTNESSTGLVFKLEKEDDDSAFEVWCFLQDLADIRDYVKQTWEEYKRGELSFMAACLITDTAFGLMRHADDDFAARSNSVRSSEWLKVMDFLGLDVFKHGHGVFLRPDPKRRTAEPRLPDSNINIVDLLSPIAYLCLEAYKKDAAAACTLHPPSVPCATSQSKKDHVHEFQGVLYGISGQLDSFAHPEKFPVQIGDGFVEGLGEIHLNSRIRFWMVAACQINLDIYALLGRNHVSNGVTPIYECSDTIAKLMGDIDALSAYSNDVRETTRSREILRLHREWVSRVHLVRSNEDADAAKKSGKEGSSALEGYLPIFAGTQLADLKLRMYDVATKVADYGTFVLTAAHLYKSLRAQGSLQADWHDMNLVLAAFGKKHALVPQLGKRFSAEQAWRHYMLALGHSLQDLPAGANPAASIKAKPKQQSRKIANSSALLQALLNRAHLKYNHRAAHSRNEIVTTVLHGIADEDSAATTAKSADSRSRKLQKYTPLQLMGAMKVRLIQDEQFINFDFAAFTLSCKNLLDDLSFQLGHLVSSIRLSDDELHRDLVGRIIYYAGDNKMTQSIADFLASHFEAKGNIYTKKAFDQSSGRIPKSLRPKFESDDIPEAFWDDVHQAMYGGADTVFAASGPTVAIYHPKLEPNKPSICNVPDCPVHCANLSDASLNDAQSDEFATSTMPEAMMKEIREHTAKDPAKTAEIYHDLTYHLVKRYKSLGVSPAKLRRMSLSTTGMDLKQIAPDENGIEWIYIRPELEKSKFLDFFARKCGEYYTQKARERGGFGAMFPFATIPEFIPVRVFVSRRVLDEEKEAGNL